MSAPPLAIEQPDGTRIYHHPLTDEEVPSVTSILNMIGKPPLPGWASRRSAEYADRNWADLAQLPPSERVERIRLAPERESGAARALGTAVHELIEDWGKGIPHQQDARVSRFADQYVRFLMRFKPEFTEQETTVWSRRHKYAGTLDFMASIGGDSWLIDVKTGRSIHGENAIQASALANADFILRTDGTEEEMPRTDFLGVLHLRPRSWHLYSVNDREENFAAFLAARRIWDWKHDTERTAFRKVALYDGFRRRGPGPAAEPARA